MERTKPSEFKEYPWDSALQSAEAETVARNVMVILSRTTDEFREITWEEYETERKKDAGFSYAEKIYFLQIIPYFHSVNTVRLFSKSWT